jgi:hypothetical protein
MRTIVRPNEDVALPTKGFRAEAQPLGIRPDIDADKTLNLAAEIEDSEILRKLELCRGRLL